ncbi:hypothetical protein Ancab_013118 [Ancistrocladus abbreviatus]
MNGESLGLYEKRERTSSSNVGSSATEQECLIYQELQGLLREDGPRKEPVKLKDNSHKRSRKKTLEDILVLGSQKTRLLMQRSMKKQVKARLNSNKKNTATPEERCGEFGETINDSQILNRNRILYDMNE